MYREVVSSIPTEVGTSNINITSDGFLKTSCTVYTYSQAMDLIQHGAPSSSQFYRCLWTDPRSLIASSHCNVLGSITGARVPNARSPASPSPGTMKPFSESPASIMAAKILDPAQALRIIEVRASFWLMNLTQLRIWSGKSNGLYNAIRCRFITSDRPALENILYMMPDISICESLCSFEFSLLLSASDSMRSKCLSQFKIPSGSAYTWELFGDDLQGWWCNQSCHHTDVFLTCPAAHQLCEHIHCCVTCETDRLSSTIQCTGSRSP